MSTLSQWLGDAGQRVGDDVLGRVTDELGLPTLPPLSIVPPNTNPNNYVTARPDPIQPPAAEVEPVKNFFQKYWKVGAGVLGVVVLVLAVKRR